MLNRHIAIYGTTKIPRGYCSLCKDYAFIIDGIIQCCETLVVGSLSRKPKRMIEAEQVRRRPSKKAVREMIDKQGNKCIYCDITFETSYKHPRLNKFMKTKMCYDHFVPYAYSQDNRDVNFVLACGTCNLIKSDLIFTTLEEAKLYVEHRRKKKGYTQ